MAVECCCYLANLVSYELPNLLHTESVDLNLEVEAVSCWWISMILDNSIWHTGVSCYQINHKYTASKETIVSVYLVSWTTKAVDVILQAVF